MTTVDTRDALLADLGAAAPATAGTDPLAQLRARAAAALEGARLPTLKDEAWRVTPLGSLLAHRYRPVATRPAGVLMPDITRFLVPEAEDHRLVFVDGHYAPELSSTASPCPGLILGPLSQVDPAVLGPHLGAHADLGQDVFTALSARFATEGAAIVVPDGLACDQPIQLLFVSTGQGDPAYVAPRVLIVAGKHAEITVMQEYVVLAEHPYFTNAVTEVAVGEGGRVRHVRVQSESRQATHLERLGATLARDAAYALQSITLGARLSRLDVCVTGEGENMDAALDGLALLGGDQEADTHSAIVHARPHGRSHQLHKMVIDDTAHAVFNGKIVVAPGAQLTDSSQAGRGLLLSDRARIDTKPELEIEADDVKCAHGVAIGQIDQEQLFYLKARGIDEATARDLLTYAFAAEVIDHVPLASLRKQLQAVVVGRTDRKKKEART